MKPSKVYTAIGLMSGTSLDGVDAALIETDGYGFMRPLDFITIPYEQAVRDVIRPAYGIKDKGDTRLAEPVRVSTAAHIEAVRALLKKSGRKAEEIHLIGYHGQTVYHAPKDGVTVQIGDGALMAKTLGINVVDDFRSYDVSQGGEGAPLAPVYHAARVRSAGIALPVVILNIGGVANVTWIGEGENDLIAFDCGPGNALMDDWVLSRTGARYDEDGKLAASGRVHEALLNTWLGHSYFSRKAPKSLDRDQWDIAAMGQVAEGMGSLSTEDGAATLMRFTAEGIVKSLEYMPVRPNTWYACGGGRHNKALMAALNEALNGAVESVDDLGWDGDATEAECFAYLGVRSLLGLPLSFPGTTGAPKPVSGGVLHKKN